MTKAQLIKIDAYVKKAMAESKDPQHDYEHVDKVRKNALTIARIIKVEKELDLNLLQAACLLHDIAYTKHKNGLITFLKETRYLKGMLPGILKQFRLSKIDNYLLSEAVYRHTWSFPFRFLNQKYSIYSQLVQDADFLEFVAKTRLINLKKNRYKSRFYRIVSLFSGLFVKRIRKNMKPYLNLPEFFYEYLNEEEEW
jgi:HD superfamily phosphohydrolase YqeK